MGFVAVDPAANENTGDGVARQAYVNSVGEVLSWAGRIKELGDRRLQGEREREQLVDRDRAVCLFHFAHGRVRPTEAKLAHSLRQIVLTEPPSRHVRRHCLTETLE